MIIHIKSKLTFRNSLIFLQRNSHFITVLLFIVLSLTTSVLDVSGRTHFNGIKEKILNSNVMQMLHLPAQGMNNIINYSTEYFSLKQENDRLKAACSKLVSFNIDQLKHENNELKQLLNFIEAKNFSTITTKFLWIINNKTASYGVIGAGSSVGIKKGQIVINDKGLAGKITQVNLNTAYVLLVYDHNFRISAKMMQGKTEAIVAGRGDRTTLGLMYVDKERLVHGTDYLVTVGDSPDIPPGILIGSFQAPDSVLTHIEWDKLNFVSIIVNKE